MQMAMEKIRIPNIDLPHPNHLEWQDIIDDDQHEFWDSEVFEELRDEIEEEVRQNVEDSVESGLYDDDEVMARFGRSAVQEGHGMDEFNDMVYEEANPRVDEEVHDMIIKWLKQKGKVDIGRVW